MDHWSQLSDDDRYITLQTRIPINTVALAKRFEELEEVAMASPELFIGDGDRVTATETDNGVVIAYSKGWGDCPSGCINRHVWAFRVAPDGRVSYLGSAGPDVSASR